MIFLSHLFGRGALCGVLALNLCAQAPSQNPPPPPGQKPRPPRARASLPRLGEETREIDNVVTQRHETVHTFGWYLRKFIADTKANGATPIVCSLVPRKIWQDGRIVRNKDSHAGWAEQVAKAEGVAFVDLNEIIALRYEALGEEQVNPLFGDAHTHTSPAGAETNAQCVIAGLKGLPTSPLAAFLSAKVGEVLAWLP
jgi:hypothetical protein